MTDKAEIEALVVVERIECVSYDTGFEEPTDPIWRICVGEFGADFDYELAAQNVADAINKAHAAALTALQADLAAAVARAEKAEGRCLPATMIGRAQSLVIYPWENWDVADMASAVKVIQAVAALPDAKGEK